MNNDIERQKMKRTCEIFGVDIADVERKLASLGDEGLLVSRYDDDADGYKFRSIRYYDTQGLHLNRFYYVMASLALKDVNNVLELGTGDALSTVVLSNLFPKAGIFTVDLPQDDPMYKRWHQKTERAPKREKQRKERLGRENITAFEINTFFLPILRLPEKFEFILVDGDHTYPQCPGDVIFAYSRVAEGGFVFFHDYYEEKNPDCCVKEVVDWMAKRIPEKVFTFPMGTPPKTPWQKMALIVRGLKK